MQIKQKTLFTLFFVFLFTLTTNVFAKDSEKPELPPPPMQEIGSLDWMVGKSGFQAATKMLKEDERPFLIYFYNADCSDICAQFEELVLADKNLISNIESFTRIVINSDEEKRLSGRFGIQEFPALLVMRTSGSAQRVGLPKTEEDVLLYDPKYVIEKMKLSGLISKV